MQGLLAALHRTWSWSSECSEVWNTALEMSVVFNFVMYLALQMRSYMMCRSKIFILS